MIETGFGKEFSEPPSVSVSGTRTHCEVCGATLDVNVMHKCAGNAEWKPALEAASHPDLTHYTGVCPQCHGKKPEPDVPHEPCELCGGAGVIG